MFDAADRRRQVYGPAAQARPEPAEETPRSSSCIPKLQPEFFGSPFYRRFHIQRPIVDPTEFSARFYESEQGKPESLGVAGGMICMLLGRSRLFSYTGLIVQSHGPPRTASTSTASKSLPTASTASVSAAAAATRWSARSSRSSTSTASSASPHGTACVCCCSSCPSQKVPNYSLQLSNAPQSNYILSPDVQTQLERLVSCPLSSAPTSDVCPQAMYEATVSQVYTLCSLGSLVKSGQGEFVDALVRARIFWYGHVHEGITSGLRGGRLILYVLTCFIDSHSPLAARMTTCRRFRLRFHH